MRGMWLKWMRLLLGGMLAMVLIGGGIAFANRIYTACPGCNAVTSVDCVYINNTAHRWGGCLNLDCVYHDGTTESHVKSSVVSSTATCFFSGTITYHCDVCDSNFTETGKDPTKHHGSLVYTGRVEPAHTMYGRTEFWYCGYCNKYFSDAAGTAETTYMACYLPPLGHDANLPWLSTSTEHWRVCSCGEQFLKNPHQPGLAATCVVPLRCLVCDYVITPALGHDFETEFTVDLTPTCTRQGIKSQHCTRCFAKQNETAIPASHTPGQPATCTTGQLCTVCSQQLVFPLGHTGVINPAVPATCTQSGLTAGSDCSRCGEVLVPQTVTSALGHNFQLDVTRSVAPTCTAEGKRAYTCTRCSAASDQTLTALGHNEVADPAVPATCVQSGLTAGSHCSVCRATLIPQTVIPALGHDFENEFTVDVPNTCSKAGSKSQHCKRCWAKQNEMVIPAAHTPGQAATCTTGQYCTVCNYQVTLKLGHNFQRDAARDVAPACTAGGIEAYACSRCDATSDAALSVLGHDYRRDAARDVAPTCTAGGIEAYACSRCDATSDAALSVLGHDYRHDAARDVTPTCTAGGIEAYTCSRCDAANDRSLSALVHTEVTDRAVPPTCTQSGLTAGSHCSVCSATLVAQTNVSALGHDYRRDAARDIASTCLTGGAEAYTCSRCGAANDRSLSALVHTEVTDRAVPPTCTQSGLTAGSHCSVCSATLVAQTNVSALGHDYRRDAARDITPCLAGGAEAYTCSRCGAANDRSLSALGHTEVTDPAVPPTCTQSGLTAGSHCSVCSATLVAQTNVSALGHDYRRDAARDIASTCLTGGAEAYTCSRCGAINDRLLSALGHTEVADPSVPATCTQSGLTEGRYCSVCGSILTRQTIIPATGHNYAAVKVVAPTCTENGYTLIRCTNCGDEHEADQTGSLGHLYGGWMPDGKGNHTSACKRCGHTAIAECAWVAVTIGNSTVSTCPVCGDRFTGGSEDREEASFAIVVGARAEALENNALPALGEMIIRYLDTPFGTGSIVSRLYAIAFVYDGKPETITGLVRITIPIEGELPVFRLVFTDESGKEIELEYEIVDGMLSFELSSAGILALIVD